VEVSRKCPFHPIVARQPKAYWRPKNNFVECFTWSKL